MSARLESGCRFIAMIGAALFATLDASAVLAAHLRATPSLTVEERWDSNIFGTSTNEAEDYVLRATPSLMFSLDAFRSTINLTGSCDGEKHARHDELDSFTVTKYLNLAPTEPLQLGPHLSLSPSAHYLDTRDALRRNTLAQGPTPSLPLVELAATAGVPEREYLGALAVGYRVGPNTDLSVRGMASRHEFLEAVPGLFDSRTQSGSVSATYRMSPQFSSGVFLDATYISYDGRPNSRTYAGGVSASYAISPQYTTDARVGASMARETAIGDTEQTETWAPYGRLSLTYTSQNFTGMVAASYELSGETSFGTTTRRTTAYLALSDRLSARWSWSLLSSYQLSRSTDPTISEDLATWTGTAGMEFAAAEWISFRFSGNVLRQWSQGTVGADLGRETVSLGFIVRDTYTIF